MDKYPEPSKAEIETLLLALAAETRAVGVELLDYLDMPKAHIYARKLVDTYPTYFSRILVNYYNDHIVDKSNCQVIDFESIKRRKTK